VSAEAMMAALLKTKAQRAVALARELNPGASEAVIEDAAVEMLNQGLLELSPTVWDFLLEEDDDATPT
jgi:hypothetical protein